MLRLCAADEPLRLGVSRYHRENVGSAARGHEGSSSSSQEDRRTGTRYELLVRSCVGTKVIASGQPVPRPRRLYDGDRRSRNLTLNSRRHFANHWQLLLPLAKYLYITQHHSPSPSSFSHHLPPNHHARLYPHRYPHPGQYTLSTAPPLYSTLPPPRRSQRRQTAFRASDFSATRLFFNPPAPHSFLELGREKIKEPCSIQHGASHTTPAH